MALRRSADSAGTFTIHVAVVQKEPVGREMDHATPRCQPLEGSLRAGRTGEMQGLPRSR